MRGYAFCVVVCLWMLSAAGCTADATPRGGCDVDDDCAAGLYCGASGCLADCRVDRDCIDRGASFACTSRGRCATTMDGGVDGGIEPCTNDSQCDDGLFCTGTEVCTPGGPDTDGRGCAQIASECSPAECDEAAHVCDPCRSADDDHDGYDAVRCGGADCDDSDPSVGPGRGEVCDAAGVDEDCNPSTLGAVSQDQDGDGFWPPETPVGTPCCNGAVCGTDCADVVGPGTFARDRFPGARESCNGLDDDCNGMSDEVSTLVYADCDGDGFGDNVRAGRAGCPGPATLAECPLGVVTAGWVGMLGDCDDTVSSTHIGAADLCNGVDDDCAAPVDPPECACINGTVAFCGYSTATTTRCARIMATCVSGAYDCPPGLITGSETESCDGIDENCDGAVDEGIPTGRYYRDADRDGYGDSAVFEDACRSPTGYISTVGDCDDANAAAHPGALPDCSLAYDQDCVGGLDNTQWTPCYTATDPDHSSFNTCTGRRCAGAGACAVAGPDARYRTDGDRDGNCTGADDGFCVGYPVPGPWILSSACRATPDDCNDGDWSARYGATETVDGRDNDCVDGCDNGLTRVVYSLRNPADDADNMLSDSRTEAGWAYRYQFVTYISPNSYTVLGGPLVRCRRSTGRHYTASGFCAAGDTTEGSYGYLLRSHYVGTNYVFNCAATIGGASANWLGGSCTGYPPYVSEGWYGFTPFSCWTP